MGGWITNDLVLELNLDFESNSAQVPEHSPRENLAQPLLLPFLPSSQGFPDGLAYALKNVFYAVSALCSQSFHSSSFSLNWWRDRPLSGVMHLLSRPRPIKTFCKINVTPAPIFGQVY